METKNKDQEGLYPRALKRLREEWLPVQLGKTFTNDDVYRFFKLDSRPNAVEAKRAMALALYNITHVNKEHELVQNGKYYRLVDKSLDEIRWWENNEEAKECPLRLPLGLNDYCVLDTPCLIVIASPTNQGKTALMLNILNQNLDTYKDNIFLFESDPVEQLKRRFKHFEFPIPTPPPFKVYRRLTNFEDVIVPGGLNLIDYIRVDTQRMWAIQDTMLKILSRLTTGIAVVGLQKPPGRDFAYGKDFTAFDSHLYLSIDKSKIRFIKIKTPKQLEDGTDPYKIAIEFKIRYGVQLYDFHTVSIDKGDEE